MPNPKLINFDSLHHHMPMMLDVCNRVGGDPTQLKVAIAAVEADIERLSNSVEAYQQTLDDLIKALEAKEASESTEENHHA